MEKPTKELLKRFMECYHITLKKGDGAELLLPFMIMIAHQDLFNESVRKITVKGDSKYVRNLWTLKYRQFETLLTKCYDLDNMDYLGDLTDGFEDFIKDKMTLTRAAIIGALPIEDFDVKCKISDAILCSILAQSANQLWENIYGKPNQLLTAVDKLSLRFCGKVHPLSKGLNLNGEKNISEAVYVLCNKMLDFVQMKIS